ncbi:Vesicle-associated protein 2-1 [Cucurbita argyrosperma subsp. argyrosperma]|nr:Vesicle-associated protein 2-1 [Cucurbita argyrosperma subsp. argyrosperma]
MSAGSGNRLISIQPDELKFQIELEKQSFCDLKVANNTEHHVAFKVKTTSPKKYFVRPNTGVVQPWDSCIIRGLTLQAQREYPADMQCRDKFLLQSTIVPPNTDVDELPADAFNKDSGRAIEECKLKALQRLKEDRDMAIRQTHQLQQELDMMKRRKYRKGDPGFSFTFAIFVGIVGIIAGFLLNFTLSSPSTE